MEDRIKDISEKVESYLKIDDYEGLNKYIINFYQNQNDLTLYVALLTATFRRKFKLSNRERLMDFAIGLAKKKLENCDMSENDVDIEVGLLLDNLK